MTIPVFIIVVFSLVNSVLVVILVFIVIILIFIGGGTILVRLMQSRALLYSHPLNSSLVDSGPVSPLLCLKAVLTNGCHRIPIAQLH